MAETYPSNLPLPEHVSYSTAQGYGVVRTSIPGPSENQAVYFNAPSETISAQWAMDDADYAAWLAWMQANCYTWFYMPVVSSHAPVNITSTVLVRAITPISRQLAGYNWQRVSLTLELVPGQADDPLAPAPSWDFIDGGSNAIPPIGPDIGPIEGGTPANPSPGLIWAQLYDY